MMNDINKGQSADINLERKRGKAIFSSILGAINVSILSIFSFYPYNYPFGEIAQDLSTKLMLRILLITILVALIGLILGIMSLKTSKKRFAIVGIVLGIIGLLNSIFLYMAEVINST